MNWREEGFPIDGWIALGLLVTIVATAALLVWHVTDYLAGLPNPIPL